MLVTDVFHTDDMGVRVFIVLDEVPKLLLLIVLRLLTRASVTVGSVAWLSTRGPTRGDPDGETRGLRVVRGN